MFFEILSFSGALNGRFASLRRPATRLGRTNANAPLAERYGYIDARARCIARARTRLRKSRLPDDWFTNVQFNQFCCALRFFGL